MATSDINGTWWAALLAVAVTVVPGCGGGDSGSGDPDGDGGSAVTAESCFDPILHAKGTEVRWTSTTAYQEPALGSTREMGASIVIEDAAAFNGQSGLLRTRTRTEQVPNSSAVVPVVTTRDDYLQPLGGNAFRSWGYEWEGPPRLGSGVVRYSPPLDDPRGLLKLNEPVTVHRAGHRIHQGYFSTEEFDFDERYTVTFRGRESREVLGKRYDTCRFEYSASGVDGAPPQSGVTRVEWVVRGITVRSETLESPRSQTTLDSVTVNGQPF